MWLGRGWRVEVVLAKKRKGRVGFGGVVRTAIWAGAFCYVVGVLGEVAKGPF